MGDHTTSGSTLGSPPFGVSHLEWVDPSRSHKEVTSQGVGVLISQAIMVMTDPSYAPCPIVYNPSFSIGVCPGTVDLGRAHA